MELEDLGYTEKWLEFGLLNEEILIKQFAKIRIDEDFSAEYYRYEAFLNWLNQKSSITDLEISNYIELALEDSDQLMAGSAVQELFTSSIISEIQFNRIKKDLVKFGNWTLKLIKRQELKRKIDSEPITEELLEDCINYTKKFEETVLLKLIIESSNNLEFITNFTSNDYGKKIRNLANEKLNKIKKKGNVTD